MAIQKAIHVTYELVRDGAIFDGLEPGYFAVKEYELVKVVMKINSAHGFWPYEVMLRSPEKSQNDRWIFEVLPMNDIRWWNG